MFRDQWTAASGSQSQLLTGGLSAQSVYDEEEQQAQRQLEFIASQVWRDEGIGSDDDDEAVLPRALPSDRDFKPLQHGFRVEGANATTSGAPFFGATFTKPPEAGSQGSIGLAPAPRGFTRPPQSDAVEDQFPFLSQHLSGVPTSAQQPDRMRSVEKSALNFGTKRVPASHADPAASTSTDWAFRPFPHPSSSSPFGGLYAHPQQPFGSTTAGSLSSNPPPFMPKQQQHWGQSTKFRPSTPPPTHSQEVAPETKYPFRPTEVTRPLEEWSVTSESKHDEEKGDVLFPKAKNGNIVLVQNMEPRTTQDQFFQIFFPMGAKEVKILSQGAGTRKSGVVYFDSRNLAETAAQKMNNFVPHGQTQPLTATFINDSEASRAMLQSILTATPQRSAMTRPTFEREQQPQPFTASSRPVSVSVHSAPPASQFSYDSTARDVLTVFLSGRFTAPGSTPMATLPQDHVEPTSRRVIKTGSPQPSTTTTVHAESRPSGATTVVGGGGGFSQGSVRNGANWLRVALGSDTKSPITPSFLLDCYATYPDTAEMTIELLRFISRYQTRGSVLFLALLGLLREPSNAVIRGRVQEALSRTLLLQLLEGSDKSVRIAAAIGFAGLFDQGFLQDSPFVVAKKLMSQHVQSANSANRLKKATSLDEQRDLVECLMTMTRTWTYRHPDRVISEAEVEFLTMVQGFYDWINSSGVSQMSDVGGMTPDSASLRPLSNQTTPEKPRDLRLSLNGSAERVADPFGTSSPNLSAISVHDSSAGAASQTWSMHNQSLESNDDALAASEAQACTVYITRIPSTTPEARLRAMFLEFGQINKVRLYEDLTSKAAYGFIEFTTPEAATQMIATCDRRKLDNAIIRCNTAKKAIRDQDPRDAIFDTAGDRIRDCLFGLSAKPRNGNIRRSA